MVQTGPPPPGSLEVGRDFNGGLGGEGGEVVHWSWDCCVGGWGLDRRSRGSFYIFSSSRSPLRRRRPSEQSEVPDIPKGLVNQRTQYDRLVWAN